MTDYSLALQVKPPSVDVATPLLAAAKIRAADQEAKQNEFKHRQDVLGSLARGLVPYVDTPQFAQKWGEMHDEALANGAIDQRAHSMMRDNPSTLALQHILLKTSTPAEAQRQMDSADFNRQFGNVLGGGRSASAIGSAPVGGGIGPQPTATEPGARAEVAPSAKVWGDKEAEAAGLYEPASGGPAPTPTPAIARPTPSAAATAGAIPSDVPGLAQNPASGKIQQLMALMAHPGIKADQKKGIELSLQKELDNSKLPDHVKEYLFYKAQTGVAAMPINEWDLQRRRAAATMINTTEGMDAAQTKARIAIDTHAVQDLSKKAVSGRSAVPLLDQIISLANKTPGGWAGSVSPVIARAMSGLGMEVPENISNAELLVSLSRQFIPSVRDPGSTSNYEQQLYTTAVPGLAQSNEGRLKVARMFRAQIDRNNDILKIYRENIGSPDLDKKLSELDAKPVFAENDRKALETEAQKIVPAKGTSQVAPPPAASRPRATNEKGEVVEFDGKFWVPVK